MYKNQVCMIKWEMNVLALLGGKKTLRIIVLWKLSLVGKGKDKAAGDKSNQLIHPPLALG